MDGRRGTGNGGYVSHRDTEIQRSTENLSNKYLVADTFIASSHDYRCGQNREDRAGCFTAVSTESKGTVSDHRSLAPL